MVKSRGAIDESSGSKVIDEFLPRKCAGGIFLFGAGFLRIDLRKYVVLAGSSIPKEQQSPRLAD